MLGQFWALATIEDRVGWPEPSANARVVEEDVLGGGKRVDIAWIEEASKALEQEPISLEFVEEVLVA